MGLLDGAIQPILYACYAVYVLMGIALLTMGAVYMGETGATGSTGGSLLFLGGCPLSTLASPAPHRRAPQDACSECVCVRPTHRRPGRPIARALLTLEPPPPAGIVMLILGALAIFANYGNNWMILSVIMVISLGLFLFLTATIVVRPRLAPAPRPLPSRAGVALCACSASGF